ncbi:D-alanyl-D-alanine carboxypeptidase/D-alanyl-D-alanine endopeptidase [Sphaerimonospora thailandensis]|uniref:D-alanyl-D-alanine carboxypeptidase n=1 Tax=Sphaerimonospora thailandensis TaxID=795644 RepID=A0A8J3R9C2_9ACTN|nr:D-alanyl-D-alanine carboxypeptidase/D-alanyl-D-alanine-endopeptidase [Sphaerimonospora thailandensis]GIH70823.1 D-alanyl-D-alanine carboxypeptidase [Sphaerimonospora thailandensis]
MVLRRERWMVLATLALLQIFVVVAGVYGYVVIHDATRTPAPIASPEPTPTPIITAGPVLAAAGDGVLPAKGTLTSRLRGAMGAPGLGRNVAGIVLDARTGETLFDGRSTAPTTPASTTKVVTALAVLAAVGPDARFATRVVQGEAKNSIVLVGGGDPTLAGLRGTGKGGYPRPASLAQLASRTAKALKAARTTRVTLSYDASLFAGPRLAPGWKPNYIPEGSVAPVAALTMDEGRTAGGGLLADPPRETAAAFAALLRRNGVKVGDKIAPADAPPTDQVVSGSPGTDASNADGQDGAAQNGVGQNRAGQNRAGQGAGARVGQELARVESPPVYALVERMLTLSDNDLAEALARQVAVQEGTPHTFTGATDAIHRVLARLKLDEGVEVHDGSGLSTRNRITPAALGRLLAAAASPANPALHSLISGLPVAGFTGTLHGRYGKSDSAAGAGLVRAKTGTLNGVNTLAGISYTTNGRLVTFAFMADEVADAHGAIVALDKMATIVSQS